MPQPIHHRNPKRTMRGALRSKRCQRCRRRKIKCDENWPTCGPCTRAGSLCSGPPVGDKFPEPKRRSSSQVYSGNGSVGGTRNNSDASASSAYERALSPTSPRHDPTTTAERVAVRLVTYLDKGPTTFDASLAACYLRQLPQRLAHSPALRDTVALFCSCWGGFRRGLEPDLLIDPKAYGKALRSLQNALNDPQQQLTDETLAATTLLDRVEVMFDNRRNFGRITHARGISSIMTKRGPPKPDNEFGVLLALANHDNMLYSTQFDGAPNLYLTPPWKAVLDTVFKNNAFRIPKIMGAMWEVEKSIGGWPKIVLDLQNLKEPVYPEYDASTQPAERVAKALAMRNKIKAMDANIHKSFNAYKDQAFKDGDFVAVVDADSVVGSSYEIKDADAAQLFLTYISVLLAFNRILYELELILGASGDALDHHARVLSKHVYMSLRWCRDTGPISAILFTWPMMLALETGSEAEKKAVLDTLLELDQYKKRLPTKHQDLEDLLLRTSRVHLGRATMGDLQRFACRA